MFFLKFTVYLYQFMNKHFILYNCLRLFLVVIFLGDNIIEAIYNCTDNTLCMCAFYMNISVSIPCRPYQYSIDNAHP